MRRLKKIKFNLLVCILFSIIGLARCDCSTNPLGHTSELAADPLNVTFEATTGKTEERSVQVFVRSGFVTISSIALLTGKEHYTLSGIPTLPKALEAGEKFTLKVTYKAPAGAPPTGVIRIESDATIPSDGRINIRLLAQSNRQRLVFTPSPVSFGEVQNGDSKKLTVKGENTGRAPLNIQKIDWDTKTNAAFKITNPPKAPMVIEPGETFTFEVEYSPTAKLLDKATMFFTCEGGCAPTDTNPNLRKDPYPLHFHGALAAPRIKLSPAILDFGIQTKGTNQTKHLTISNTGSVTLKIESIQLKKGSSGAFFIPQLSQFEIGPYASKKLPVEFKANGDVKHEGTIEIESNDTSAPVASVLLKGEVAAPDIKVVPRKIAFKVPPGKTFNVTVANVGNQPLKVSEIRVLKGSIREFSAKPLNVTIPHTLQPNEKFEIEVVYSPIDKGTDSAVMEILSNDPDEPIAEVLLQGESTTEPTCELNISPTQVNFGKVLMGQSKEVKVTWTNTGTRTCNIEQMGTATNSSFGPAVINVFRIPHPPTTCTGAKERYACNPVHQILPGQVLETAVSYAPWKNPAVSTNALNHTGYMELLVRESASPIRVNLSGTTEESCIEVYPPTIDFGNVTANCSSPNESLFIYNTCRTSVSLTSFGFASGNKGFQIAQAPTTPHTLKGNQALELTLKYKAAAPAAVSDVFQIKTSFSGQSIISVPVSGKSNTTADQTDTFKQDGPGKIDVLFVIDNSGSMADDQRNLANNFDKFMSWAQKLKVDYHIGIVTTDITIANYNIPGGLIGTPPFLTSQTPNIVKTFQNHVKVGANGSDTEQGLEAMRLALSPPLITSGPNKGFLRKDALLSIIFVSDEPDQSKESSTFYSNFLLNIKGPRRKDMIRVHTVIGLKGQTACGAASVGRYKRLNTTYGGVLADICDTNWGNHLSKIGTATFGLRKQFFLTRAADPTSIVVKVNGTVIKTGFKYNVSANSIDFDTAPAQGATIEIQYKAVCL